MTNLFSRVVNDADFANFTSQGMNVYMNSAKTNLNIFGNHIYPNEKFAVSEINSNLERYLRKGFAKLLADGQSSVGNTAEIQESPKQKKKKSSENDAVSQELEVIEEISAPEQMPQSEEPVSNNPQEVIETTPETTENI